MGTPLDNAKYVSLETFKKDGTGVKTPMWAAPLGGKLVIGTDGKTYKVKRIRNNPRVRLAECNASGAQILGPWFEGTARVVEKSEEPPADAALNAKYGILRRAMGFFGRLVGQNRVIIEIALDAK
jgi:PPOX class probable F420-dependent enzyme